MMDNDALTQAVARAVHESMSDVPWDETILQDCAFARARAAIRVIAPAVLDEAAKVADEYAVFHDKHDDGLSGFDYMASGAREVAENIRTLKTRYEG